MNDSYTWSEEIRTTSTSVLIVFIVLKLTHVIDWSWWWVLSPFWITALLALLIIAVTIVLVARQRS